MKLLTITFAQPVQNPMKPQGIYQGTHSAPVDIQAQDNGRVTLTAPDGTRVVVHGIGFHGVPDLTAEREEAEISRKVKAAGERDAKEAQDFKHHMEDLKADAAKISEMEAIHAAEDAVPNGAFAGPSKPILEAKTVVSKPPRKSK